MPYQRKTIDVWNIYQLTESGWEIVNAESKWKDARASLKEYRANMPEYRFKSRKCRERFPMCDKCGLPSKALIGCQDGSVVCNSCLNERRASNGAGRVLPRCAKCSQSIRDREYTANPDGTTQHLNACPIGR